MSQSTFRGVGFRAATLERLEAEWLHWFDCEHQIGAVSRGCFFLVLERYGAMLCCGSCGLELPLGLRRAGAPPTA